VPVSDIIVAPPELVVEYDIVHPTSSGAGTNLNVGGGTYRATLNSSHVDLF